MYSINRQEYQMFAKNLERMKSNKILSPRSASKMDYQERIGSPRAEA